MPLRGVKRRGSFSKPLRFACGFAFHPDPLVRAKRSSTAQLSTHKKEEQEKVEQPSAQAGAPGESEQPRDSETPEEITQEIPKPQPPSPEPEISRVQTPVDPSKTVLVAEDDLDTADSLKVKLEAQGYNVLTIFDGLQALETARKIRPALIVLDVMMPRLMGYHICRLLKFDERFRNIPIIILTGKVDRESKEIGTKAGADLYLTKPFELNDLLTEVKKFIG